MTKVKKQQKRKCFKYNINRKRLRNRLQKTKNLECKIIKDVWDNRKSFITNLTEMGLSSDPNKTIQISTEEHQKQDKKMTMTLINSPNKSTNKSLVVEKLEKDAKEPRVKQFRLPKKKVEWLTYLLDKYGDDYKSMSRDKKNYNQETYKQIRSQIKQFKKIPEQYNEYLAKKSTSTNNN